MIAQSVLFQDWHARYCAERDLSLRTRKFYLSCVRSFEAWHGGPLPLTVACEKLNEFLEQRSAGNRYSAHSLRCGLVVMLRAAQLAGLCRLPPKIRPIRRPDHRPRGIRPDEFLALTKHASPIQRAAMRLAYDTGLRKSDLFAVRWAQVIGRRGDWRIVHTAAKTGRRVVRRIRNETYEELDALRNPDDDRLLPSDVRYTGWRKRWHKLGRAAGVDTRRRGLQAIRRTGASMTKRGGGNPSDYLGHSAHSAGLAERFYIDPELVDDAPPLPPEL